MDLQTVLNEVFDVRAKWYTVGLELKMNAGNLEAIKIKCRDDPDECFRELLSTWLKQVYPKPTWTALANALESRTVGNEQLAEVVRQNHLPMHAKISISTESIDGNQSTVQLQTVNEFQCPCGRCDLLSYLDKGCPKSSSHSYPYLLLSDLSEEDKQDLVQKLSEDTANIIQCFADLLSNTSKSLKNRNITVAELVKVALDLGAYKSDRNPVPLLDDDRIELQQAMSIDNAFIILGKHMSFFNYEVLGHIIRHLGSDCDKKNLEKFCSQFKTFCERKLFEVSPSVFDPSGPERKDRQYFVVLGTNDLFETLHDVKAAQRKVATLLGLRVSTIQLKRIDIGSVILVFSIPKFVSNDLFPLKPSKCEKMKSNGYTFIIPYVPKDQKIQAHKVQHQVSRKESDLSA